MSNWRLRPLLVWKKRFVQTASKICPFSSDLLPYGIGQSSRFPHISTLDVPIPKMERQYGYAFYMGNIVCLKVLIQLQVMSSTACFGARQYSQRNESRVNDLFEKTIAQYSDPLFFNAWYVSYANHSKASILPLFIVQVLLGVRYFGVMPLRGWVEKEKERKNRTRARTLLKSNDPMLLSITDPNPKCKGSWLLRNLLVIPRISSITTSSASS